MGAGSGGGYANLGPSLQGNVQAVVNKYPYNSHSGLFGVKGNGSARVIISDNPPATAKAFFKDLSKGGMTSTVSKSDQKGMKITKFIDGSSVSYRPNSKSGSPSVNLLITTGSKNQNYKIHFEQTGWMPKKEKQ